MKIDCPDWRDDPAIADGGTCELGWYGGRPSYGVCLHCLKTGRKGEGLGDTVAKTIHAVTGGRVRPCAGCGKRRRRLNDLLPRSG